MITTSKLTPPPTHTAPSSVHLDVTGFYRGTELEQMFGRRFVAELRRAGLQPVADWYLGEEILRAFRSAVDLRRASLTKAAVLAAPTA